MLIQRIYTCFVHPCRLLPRCCKKFYYPTTFPNSGNTFIGPNLVKLGFLRTSPATPRFMSSYDSRRSPVVPLPPVESADRADVFRALEASLGHSFSSNPLAPSPNPLIIVISGPSGVGKDAVIKRLQEVREGIHFVVTPTSRPKRPGEVNGKDYYFVTKEDFLSMVAKHELLEYALVYGDYKGIPKQQVREYMAMGCDIVLRVDIQGAVTLKSIFRDSAVFIFLVVESEAELVERLIDRKTETVETLLVRVNTAREEVKHLAQFDYVVVNPKGKLETAVELVVSIIDAEKAKVCQRAAVV